MFKITKRLILSQDVKRVEIFAPVISRRAKPGQFVVVIPQEKSSWVPLAVVEADPSRGHITLVFQERDEATRHLGSIPINESVFSVVGPLGNPATIEKFGTVICVTTDLGSPQMLPVCRALKDKGNKVIGILGAKSRRPLMLEPQIRMACHKMYITTEDGSFERRGVPTDVLKDLLEKEKVKLVYAIGAVEMMQAACAMTQAKGIKTLIQVSSGIFCGMGICGSCRIKVGGQTILACQKGPEFDGHKVNFDGLRTRMEAYRCLRESGQPEGLSETERLSQVVSKFFPGFLEK